MLRIKRYHSQFAALFGLFCTWVVHQSLIVTASQNYRQPQTYHNNDNPPHIVFVLADDVGFNDVGFQGSRQVKTPNLDRLAREGIILDNQYAMPLCSPSRASLLTGRYPIHTSSQHWVYVSADVAALPLNETLLPQYLKRAGYATHMVGKWNLGFHLREYTPTFRGFDTYFGYYNPMQDYCNHSLPLKTDGYDLRDNLEEVAERYAGQYSTDLFTRKAIERVNQHDADKPLFLYLAHQAVHSGPYIHLQYTEERYERFPNIADDNRRKFNAMMAALDDSIGAVFNALHKRKFTDNLIFIFSSDNGGPPAGLDDNYASNWPLRGSKGTLWEGGVKVPAFVWSSRLQHSGYRSHQLMHLTDWLPTLMSQVTPDETYDNRLDGLNMWSALSQNSHESVRDDVLLNYDRISKVAALRTAGGWKLIYPNKFEFQWNGWYRPESDPNPMSNTHCGQTPTDVRHACRQQFDAENNTLPCLFNLNNDPCEWRNVAWLYSDIVERLRKKLLEYMKTAVRAPNLPRDPRADPQYHNHTWTWWMEDYGGFEEEHMLQQGAGRVDIDNSNPLENLHGFLLNTPNIIEAKTQFNYDALGCQTVNSHAAYDTSEACSLTKFEK